MKSFLFVLLGAFSLSACAQSPAPGDGEGATEAAPAPATAGDEADTGTADGRAVAAIRKLNPQVAVDRVAAAPIDGFREVVVGGQVLYVSDDGRYLLQGSLFDIEARKDLSQVGLAEVRRELIAEVPQSDRIVFAPDDPEYTVTVFTDVECGYCRKLHQEIAEYNRLGIAIEYLAFPRMGPASPDFEEMVSVWCADDRRQALTDAKSDKRVPKRNCTSPVSMHYQLGQRIGLTGTPMIVTESGVQMPGYMPPKALREALDQLDAEAAGG
ncbi:DsbC family protein [Luteimonas suaedae]|uniref:DsbC family protein n=1 Tax=Luteimonas suaedae TaxID=2605430 RepID=UPI0011EDD10D|nr:DsbC family protein [Luteimonas suaedae]